MASLVLLLPALFALPTRSDDESSWLRDQWLTAESFYREVGADLRWKHLPGLRMTLEKKRALWDEALEVALVEDDWLGRPPGKILFHGPRDDPDYTPSVEKLSFRRLGPQEAGELAEQYGQSAYVGIHGPRPVGPDSVTIWVFREVDLNEARRETKEVGCSRRIRLACERTWGEWVCNVEDRYGGNCDELAYDHRRWRELSRPQLTPEERGEVWNAALEFALRQDDWLGAPPGVITLLAKALDPSYKPRVDGLSLERLTGDEFATTREADGQIEYISLGDSGRWSRGPAAVYLYVSRRLDVVDAATQRRGTIRSAYVELKCESIDSGWSCSRNSQSRSGY